VCCQCSCELLVLELRLCLSCFRLLCVLRCRGLEVLGASRQGATQHCSLCHSSPAVCLWTGACSMQKLSVLGCAVVCNAACAVHQVAAAAQQCLYITTALSTCGAANYSRTETMMSFGCLDVRLRNDTCSLQFECVSNAGDRGISCGSSARVQAGGRQRHSGLMRV
jgi:hypothetical protein